MMFRDSLFSLVFFFGTLPPAEAVVISLFNTGVDANGNVLSPGSSDPHWTVTSSADTRLSPPAAAVVQLNHPAWLANDPVGGPGSSWVGILNPGNTNVSPGNYTIRTTFDLAGLVPDSAIIEMLIAADNSIQNVTINGNNVPGVIGSPFSGPLDDTFSITDGFVEGVNTLEVTWRNSGSSNNPGGVRVELSGTASAIPEPSGVVGLGTLLAAVLLGRVRRG
jgi:hypothetical protein